MTPPPYDRVTFAGGPHSGQTIKVPRSATARLEMRGPNGVRAVYTGDTRIGILSHDELADALDGVLDKDRKDRIRWQTHGP